MAYTIDGKLGVDFTRQDTTPTEELGTERIGSDGITYIYVEFNVALSVAGAALLLDEAFKVGNLSTSAAGSNPQRVVFCQESSAAVGEYGWVASHGGSFLINTAASCAADVKLYTTTTGGRVDDAATTLIEGLRATATQGGGAGTLAATATGPCSVNTQS